MDANKDGTIDLEEWEKHMTPELRAAIEAKLGDSGLVAGFKPLVDIARVFDQLDTDKSGDLSRDEIKHALEVLGLKDAFDLDTLLNAMDTDARGSKGPYLNPPPLFRPLLMHAHTYTQHHSLQRH